MFYWLYREFLPRKLAGTAASYVVCHVLDHCEMLSSLIVSNINLTARSELRCKRLLIPLHN
jgi:hypothetical protein